MLKTPAIFQATIISTTPSAFAVTAESVISVANTLTTTKANTDRFSHPKATFTPINYNENYFFYTDNPDATSAPSFSSLIVSNETVMATNVTNLQTDVKTSQTDTIISQTPQNDVSFPQTDSKTDVTTWIDFSYLQTDTGKKQNASITSETNKNIVQAVISTQLVNNSTLSTVSNELNTKENKQGNEVIITTNIVNGTAKVPLYTLKPETMGKIRTDLH